MSTIITPQAQNIITNHDSYNVSERYQQIPTTDIIAEMEEYHNMKIMNFGASNVRKKEKINKQKHFVIMQGDNSELIDGSHMQFGIFNSSDRSSSLKIYLSIFKFVCSNGLVLSDDLMEPISIRHTKNNDWKHSVATLMNEYETIHANTQSMVNNMLGRYMSFGDMNLFAERAAEEIINPIITGDLISPRELIVPQRIEDTGKDLYSIYNVIQEYTLQGGINRLIKKEPEDGENQGKLIDVISKTHKISDTQKQIKVNRQLHTMAMEYL